MILDASKSDQPSDATPAQLASGVGAAPTETVLARFDGAPPALLPAGTALGPLDPERLDQKALAAIAHFHQEGESENTRRSYHQALRYWLAWFELRYGRELTLPVHPATVAQFVVDHAETKPAARDQQLPAEHDARLVAARFKAQAGPLALSTIQLRLAALARLHRDQQLPSPTEDPAVHRLLRNVRSTQAKAGAAPNKKSALDRALIDRLLATCDDTPLGVRDRALLAFGFATGGRRRSEIAAADFAHLEATSDGNYRYTLAHSKTNQSGARRPQDIKPVVGHAARALTAWLEVLEEQGNERRGRIFRRMLRGGFVGGPMTPHAVREIVRSRCELAGLHVDDFSAHSLRSGFLTEAGRRGVPLKAAMDMSGHSSINTAMGYMRAGELASEPAARLLEGD
jgi:integrase